MPPDRPPSKAIKQATKLFQQVTAFRTQHSLLVTELTDLRDRLAKCHMNSSISRPMSVVCDGSATPDSTDGESIRTSLFSNTTCDSSESSSCSRMSIYERRSKRALSSDCDKFDWEIAAT